MQHAFCTFLCRRRTTTAWNCLISRFVENGNTRQQPSFSFPGLWYSPLEFNSKPFANIWRIKRDGISAIKFEAARIHFLSDVFVRSRRRRCGLNSILCLSKSGEKGGFSHPLLPFPPPPPSFSGSTSVQLLRGCISYFTNHKRKKTPKKLPATQTKASVAPPRPRFLFELQRLSDSSLNLLKKDG